MTAVAVIGDGVLVHGWALAGVTVCEAVAAAEVRQAWQRLGPDVAVVLLTPAAAAILTDELSRQDWPLPVVIPT